MSAKQKSKTESNTIATNKRARFDYQLHDRLEAGLVLEGWEVKSLRAGNCQLTDSFVQMKAGEAWLQGCSITPLKTASTHISMNPKRHRKLLLHRRELSRLIGAIGQKGQTCVLLKLYWKSNRVKCELALATGKQQQDKRQAIKARDWGRDKSRLMKSSNRL